MRTGKGTLFKHQKPKRHIRHQGCIVSGSLALMLRVSRGMLMSPLSATRAGAGWRLAVCPTLAVVQKSLFTAFCLVILAVLGWDLYVEAPNRVRAGGSTMKTTVWIAHLFLTMLIASISVYMGPSRMESLLEVVKELQQINFNLKINPPSVRSETMRSSMIICLLIWVTVLEVADVHSLPIDDFKEDRMFAGPLIGMVIGYHYAILLELIVVLQWYRSASGAHAASVALNQQLRHLRDATLMSDATSAQDDSPVAPQPGLTLFNGFMTPKKSDADELQKPQAQATIRRLAVSYDRISDVMTQLNAANGLILLLMVMTNGFRFVGSTYYLLISIFNNDEVVAWWRVVLQCNWIAFHTIKLLLLVEPCHWTQEEREQTETLLSQLTVHLAPKCESVSKELDQFAKQVMLNGAKFRPLGTSTLSRPLIVTILSSVTTYLVIMIQFNNISTQM